MCWDTSDPSHSLSLSYNFPTRGVHPSDTTTEPVAISLLFLFKYLTSHCNYSSKQPTPFQPYHILFFFGCHMSYTILPIATYSFVHLCPFLNKKIKNLSLLMSVIGSPFQD